MEAMQVRWLIQPLATALHVADMVHAGRVEPTAVADWAEPLAHLHLWMETHGAEPVGLLEQTIALAPRFEREGELAASALTKIMERAQAASLAPSFAATLGAVRRATQQTQPELGDRVEADSAALRAAWDQQGGPLVEQLRRLTGDGWLVPNADVLLVPALGGGFGAAHASANLVRIEVGGIAAETPLPQVVQVAWLLAQLNADLPVYQGSLTRQGAARAVAWAMLPVTLEAAAAHGMLVHDAATRAAALAQWHLQPRAAAGALDAWWDAYRDSRPSLPAALAALDRLLAEAG